MNNIKEKVNYCLGCKVKPCKKGCPLQNDITEIIRYMKNEEYEEAYKIATKTSVLQSVCGRICPHMSQCEGSCIRGIKSTPVSIGEIEAYLGDIAIKNQYNMCEIEKIKNNVKIAVIGSGPAGLTCAAYLARSGANVTIFEKYDKLGGILRHGIPELRLSKDILDESIKKIIDLGIKVECNKELGRNLQIDTLKQEFDAIYLAIGANISWKMNIPGEDLNGVFGGNELLEKADHPDYKGKTVIISGGGNVAMDCARTVKKLGASSVKVVYRRAQEQMPAEKKEIEDAKNEGIEFLFQNNIVKIIGDTSVKGIECVKTKLIQKEGETRLSPVNIEESNYKIDADYVIMAIGSTIEKEVIDKIGVSVNKKGYVDINEDYETSIENVFAGGDLAGTKATVAWAARSGRDAAEKILKKLSWCVNE